MKYIRFYGGNGYAGCDYEEYVAFEDDYSEKEINDYSAQLAVENAESYEWVARGGWDEEWETNEDEEWYYEDALDYCGWEYCDKEEFEENCS